MAFARTMTARQQQQDQRVLAALAHAVGIGRAWGG
jgi:hypothetical protein